MTVKAYDSLAIQRFFKILSEIVPDSVYTRDQQLVCDLFDPASGTLVLETLDCSGLDNEALHAFDVLQHLEGTLILTSSNVKELDGFNSLLSVKNLSILKMQNLETINGFKSLEKIETIQIHANPKLESIDGFNVLFSKHNALEGSLKITNNPKLTSITFLKGLRSVGSSLYLHHNGLETLKGLESLELVNASLSLSSNRLKTLEALSNLKRINGMLGVAYNNLSSLHGLENLTHLQVRKWNDNYRSMVMQGNKNLQDISALANIKALNDHMIMYIDREHDYMNKPSNDSVFSQNSFEIFNAKGKRVNNLGFIFEIDKGDISKLEHHHEYQGKSIPRILFGYKWQKITAKCEWMDASHIHFDDVDKIIAYCHSHDIQVLFGNNYTTQNLISNNAKALRAEGLKFIVNTKKTLKRLVDKQLFYDVMFENGFGENVPVYYALESEIVYPCIVKPYSGGAGRGIYIAHNFDEIIDTGKKKIISEYLPGNIEYATSIFYKDGKILHHKTYSKRVDKTHFVLQQESVNGIETNTVETPFLDLFQKIVEAFHGKEGYCLCSMNYKIVNGTMKLFEINPRTGYTLAQHTDDFEKMMQIYLDEVEKESENSSKEKPVSYSDIRTGAHIYKEKSDSKELFTHILVYKSWRVFYTLKGDRAPLDAVDSSKSGIPDYIELMLYKFETSRQLLIKSFGLRDPLKGGFFYEKGAKFIDIYIKNIPREHGIASGLVYDEQFERLKGTPYQGKSLKITIHRNLIKKTATPIHELFHIFQYSYTHFNNMWFMEGLARWSQSIMQEKIGKEEPLPQNEEELDTLVHKLHDAEFFWNRLVTLCEEEDTFIIPKVLEDNSEIYNNKKTGSRFMKVFLEQCEIQYKLMEESLKTRQIKDGTYWSRDNKRNANNNQYIFKAISNTIDMTCKVQNEEVVNFTNLIRRLANVSIEAFNTKEIQSFLYVLKKYTKGFVIESESGILYSEFFDVFTRAFSCKELDLSNSDISDEELDSFKILKRIHGSLTLKECKKLTHLNGLDNIEFIERDMTLSGMELKELNTLNRLITVNQLTIANMDKLEFISGLNSLERIKSKLLISDCMVLELIDGFETLTDVGTIEISKTCLRDCDFLSKIFKYHSHFNGAIKLTNNRLENVKCLQGLTIVNSFLYLHQNRLETLEGLEELKSVGGSLSLSANKLNNIHALKNLEKINGALALAYNALESLNGLENLRSVVTKKWDKMYFSIKFYGNKKLRDISALSKVKTKDHYLVIYFDNDINYIKKPDAESDFHKNILELHDIKTRKLIPTYTFVSKKSHNYDYFRKTTHNKLLTVLFDFEIEDAEVLVLSFTGAHGNLGGMFHNKYPLIIDTMNTHKIFLMDPSHTWYNKGVPPFTKNMDENIQFIRELILAKKYKKVVCMGTSMGAYLSLVLGCALEGVVDEALVFAPQTFLDSENRERVKDSRWKSLIKEFPEGMKEEYWDLKKLFEKYQNHTTSFTIHYGSKLLLDYHHVHHLKPQDNITLVPYDVEDHYITVMLHKQDKLKSIILDVLRRD